MKVILLKILPPFTFALISVFVLYVLQHIVLFRILHRWAKKTETGFDNIVIDSIKTSSFFWCIAIAVSIVINFSKFPAKNVFFSNEDINTLVVVSMTIRSAHLADGLIKKYIQSSQLPTPTTGLMFGIVKGTIFIIGTLIILNVLGISITPRITALGVGGLAVALVLQYTLANLFAGIHILVEKLIRIGDFIKLENVQEGFAEDISWRTTRIRMLANNMIVIPNSILAKNIVTNYDLPENRMSMLIPVSVSYASNLQDVENVLTEEAKTAAGIEIPYPHRTVYLREEKN